MKTSIYGFTLIRNAVKYDYPFRESLKSLMPLVDKIIIAEGDSVDTTASALDKLSEEGLILERFPTEWDENLRKSGLVLSQQTNLALDHLKKSVDTKNSWGFYLQADEVIHEDDVDLMLRDIQKANDEGYDAVEFRWLHFWERYEALAISDWWYPSEMRAIKLDTSIESYGDAQSFQNTERVYKSEARIFHYGHVREESAMKLKTKDFQRWWHATEDSIAKSEKKLAKKVRQNVLLQYLGPHPKVMNLRRKSSCYDNVAAVGIVGEKDSYSKEFLSSIAADVVVWGDSISSVKSQLTKLLPKSEVSEVPLVVLDDSGLLGSVRSYKQHGKFPKKMNHKRATNWNQEFLAMLKLSQKAVPTQSKSR